MLVFWVLGLTVAAGAAVKLRGRLRRAQQLAIEAAQVNTELSALLDYKEWLNRIVDNVPALIGYIDAEQRFQFHNLAYEHWLEKPKGEITGRLVREVLGEDEYLKLQPHLERALRGGHVTLHLENRIRGETRHAQTSFVPDFDHRGRARGCFVVAKDIGSVVEAQRELRSAQERHELALEASGVALWDADLQTGKVYLSEAWTAMIGAKGGDTLATLQDLAALVHPDERDTVRRGMREALKGTAPAYAAEHRVPPPLPASQLP